MAAPIPVVARSETLVCGGSLAGFVGSNLAGAWMSVPYVFCVLSVLGHCDWPIHRPEESYRVCLCVCP